MKYINSAKIFLFLSALFVSFFSFAQTYPPYPTPGTSSIYYGIYPVNIEVAYTKNSNAAQTYQLEFYIVNETSNTYNLSGYTLTASNAPSPNPVTVTSYTDNCSGVLTPRPTQQKPGTGTCTIFANISAVNKGASPITYTFQFSYASGRSPAVQAAPPFTISFATGALIPSASRTFTFVNNCSSTDLNGAQAIWLGIDSGAAQAITPNPAIQPPDPQSCVDTVNSSDCYAGSTCVQVQAKPVLNHCFWNNPAPAGYAPGNGAFKLTTTDQPGTHTTTVDFPVYDNGITTSWNGGIGARVGCSDSASTKCKIADCGAGAASGHSGDACPVPGGFATPSTLAEFSLLTQNPVITATSGTPTHDTYDITIINGVTVPISMEPTTAVWGGASAPYTCGNPGARTTTAPLGACPWFSILPPNTFPVGTGAVAADFVWVDTGGGSGTCPGTCTNGGEVCGHTVSGATVSPLTCGKQLGYLTADAVCAIDSTFGAPFYCSSQVMEGSTPYTLSSIYGCSVGDYKNSCYSAGATSACCGCEDWYSTATVPPAPLTQSCGGISNTNWQSALIESEYLPWLKQVCPTAYIYPYDDASSTFTCSDTDANNNNVVDYTITFCPA